MTSSLYKISAGIISQVLNGQGGVKSLVYNRKNADSRQNKSVYALVSQTLKYHPIIDEIIKNTEIETQLTKRKQKLNNKKQNKSLKPMDDYATVLIIIYELYFSERKNINSGKNFWKTLILKNKNSIYSNLVRLKIKNNVSNNRDLLPKSMSLV